MTSTTPPIRVMVVDDHPMWREGVSRELREAGFEVVAVVADADGAVRIASSILPDVVLMDLQLGDGSGVDATARLLAAAPTLRVLMLSASREDTDVLAAVKAGASGYLTKSARREELTAAVSATARGEVVFSPGLAGLVLGEFRSTTRQTGTAGTPQLTDRETEVVRMVAKGLTARQIAARLVLSHRTVQNHVQNVLTKLQLRNRVELARYAMEQGLEDSVD